MRAQNLLVVAALCSTLFTTTACQVKPPMPTPLSRGAAQAVKYTGAVSQESWITKDTPESPVDPGPEPEVDPQDIVHLEAQIYSIDRDVANRLLSLPHAGLVAANADHVQSQAALRTLIQRGAASLLTAEQLGCIDKSRAMLSLVRQKSYVEGYKLVGIEDAMIADPKIGVAQDGVLLDIRPTRSKDRNTLEVELKLTLTRLESPLPKVRVRGRLPTELGLLMELPVFANERLETKATLPSDKNLFFGGLAARGGGEQVMMVFLRQVKEPSQAAAVRTGTGTAGSTPP